MTTHLEDEQLAQWVLDDQTPDTAAATHLQLCARCRESYAELQEIARLSKRLPRLEQPPSELWGQINAELGLETGPVPGTDLREDGRQEPTALRPASPERTNPSPARHPEVRRFRWRALAVAATVAAVLGAGAGVAGTLLATRDDTKAPVAETMIRLTPLAGQSGDGNADLIRENTGDRLKVEASGLGAGQGFYEVWMINEDGKRMVSLGVLNPQTGGTFTIPQDLTQQGYRIVDISLEPNDGNPEHSRASIIRGTLPG
ncbi:anti-sigma factor domain-containing protein [Kribbella italica]|uniref:Anti-sigma K factor RskA C-terminal domain-containing protein n=1 Tax=Kribbella italica TaxID=1540520 RepID=A0A7W9J4Y1_9ACTN|nr:hypothetical protein [Kribbella italica]